MVARVITASLKYVAYSQVRLNLVRLGIATYVLFFVVLAHGLEGIGKLSNIIGKVSVVRSGQMFPADKDFILYETDELVTYEKTAAKILFHDGSSIMAFQNAHLKLIEYKIKPRSQTTQDVESAIDVIKGKVRFFVKPQEETEDQAGKTDAKFKTPNSVMGIRGTSGFIDATFEGNTQVIVLTGVVEVTSLSDPSKSVFVPANRFSEIVGNKAPSFPKAIPPMILNRLNTDAATLDPNIKREEEKYKKGNNNENKPGNESGSNNSSSKYKESAAANSDISEQKKQVFNPDGSSAVVSTNNSLNELLVKQGNPTLRPTSYGNYEPIKKSLEKSTNLSDKINKQVENVVQTVTTPQIRSVNIIVNTPTLP